jgi:hypothetical protein
MRPSDDPAQVLLSIRHAEQSGAKVLLAQVSEASCTESSDLRPQPTPPWLADIDSAGAGSGRGAMWAEIVSRALLLNNIDVGEIPSLVQSFQVDRVMVNARRTPDQKHQPGLERVIPALVDVPVWVLGRGVALNFAGQKPIRRILLPVTYGPDLEFVFRFSWQLAKAQLASLSILHVFSNSGKAPSASERSPLTVKSWFPWLDVNLSPADCRIEIAIRHGDPAAEIVNFNERKPHDVIVLRSSATANGSPVVQPKLVDQICSQVPCPVAVLGSRIDPRCYLPKIRKSHPNERPVDAPAVRDSTAEVGDALC